MNRQLDDLIVFDALATPRPGACEFHLHDYCELYLLLDGKLDFYVHQSCYSITAGALLVINDMEVHRAVNLSHQPHKRIFIHIPASFFRQYAAEDLSLSDCFLNRKQGEHNLMELTSGQVREFTGLFDRMTEEKQSAQPGWRLSADACLVQILILVNRLFQRQVPALTRGQPREVERIMSFVRRHMLEQFTLDDLAAEVALSKYHICHVFKKETGTTVFHYLMMQRIAHAKVLLSRGYNVTETCFQSGFGDYTHFITVFKNLTGCTPKQYQSMQRRSLKSPPDNNLELELI